MECTHKTPARHAPVVYTHRYHNQSTIKLVVRDEDAVTDRSKHIDVRYHYTKHLVKSQQLKLRHISTTDQLADMFTKALQRVQLHKLAATVMNTSA